MITYNWEILSMDVATSEDGLTNVVKSISWRYTGSDGKNSRNIDGKSTLPGPTATFVSYESLTPEIVIGWVEEAESSRIPALKAILSKAIADAAQPATVVLSPPWETV